MVRKGSKKEEGGSLEGLTAAALLATAAAAYKKGKGTSVDNFVNTVASKSPFKGGMGMELGMGADKPQMTGGKGKKKRGGFFKELFTNMAAADNFMPNTFKSAPMPEPQRQQQMTAGQGQVVENFQTTADYVDPNYWSNLERQYQPSNDPAWAPIKNFVLNADPNGPFKTLIPAAKEGIAIGDLYIAQGSSANTPDSIAARSSVSWNMHAADRAAAAAASTNWNSPANASVRSAYDAQQQAVANSGSTSWNSPANTTVRNAYDLQAKNAAASASANWNVNQAKQLGSANYNLGPVKTFVEQNIAGNVPGVINKYVNDTDTKAFNIAAANYLQNAPTATNMPWHGIIPANPTPQGAIFSQTIPGPATLNPGYAYDDGYGGYAYAPPYTTYANLPAVTNIPIDLKMAANPNYFQNEYNQGLAQQGSASAAAAAAANAGNVAKASAEWNYKNNSTYSSFNDPAKSLAFSAIENTISQLPVSQQAAEYAKLVPLANQPIAAYNNLSASENNVLTAANNAGSVAARVAAAAASASSKWNADQCALTGVGCPDTPAAIASKAWNAPDQVAARAAADATNKTSAQDAAAAAAAASAAAQQQQSLQGQLTQTQQQLQQLQNNPGYQAYLSQQAAAASAAWASQQAATAAASVAWNTAQAQQAAASAAWGSARDDWMFSHSPAEYKVAVLAGNQYPWAAAPAAGTGSASSAAPATGTSPGTGTSLIASGTGTGTGMRGGGKSKKSNKKLGGELVQLRNMLEGIAGKLGSPQSGGEEQGAYGVEPGQKGGKKKSKRGGADYKPGAITQSFTDIAAGDMMDQEASASEMPPEMTTEMTGGRYRKGKRGGQMIDPTLQAKLTGAINSVQGLKGGNIPTNVNGIPLAINGGKKKSSKRRGGQDMPAPIQTTGNIPPSGLTAMLQSAGQNMINAVKNLSG